MTHSKKTKQVRFKEPMKQVGSPRTLASLSSSEMRLELQVRKMNIIGSKDVLRGRLRRALLEEEEDPEMYDFHKDDGTGKLRDMTGLGLRDVLYFLEVSIGNGKAAWLEQLRQILQEEVENPEEFDFSNDEDVYVLLGKVRNRKYRGIIEEAAKGTQMEIINEMKAQIKDLKQELDSANTAREKFREDLIAAEIKRCGLEVDLEKSKEIENCYIECKSEIVEFRKDFDKQIAMSKAIESERDKLQNELNRGKTENLALLETTKKLEARVAELENELETAQTISKAAEIETVGATPPLEHVPCKLSSEIPLVQKHKEECSTQLLRIMEETVVSKTERATRPKAVEKATSPKAVERATSPKARRTRAEFRCWNCNERGHFQAECHRPLQRNRTYGEISRAEHEEHQGPRCWNCNIIGHFQRHCSRPIRVKTRTPQEVVRGDDANGEESLRVRGKLGNTYQEFLLDTGSFRSIIRPSLVKGRKRSRATDRFLRTANGNTVPVQGVIKTGFQLGQTHFYHEFLIADVVDDCILGFDFLQDNGLTLDLNKGRVQYKNVHLPLVGMAKRANDCKVNRITEVHDYRNQSKRPQGVCRIPSVAGTWRTQPRLQAGVRVGCIKSTREWCRARTEGTQSRSVNPPINRKAGEDHKTRKGSQGSVGTTEGCSESRDIPRPYKNQQKGTTWPVQGERHSV